MMLCGGPAMHLFSATELERLVCGNPLLDFKALQVNARYDGGYNAEHRVSYKWAVKAESETVLRAAAFSKSTFQLALCSEEL